MTRRFNSDWSGLYSTRRLATGSECEPLRSPGRTHVDDTAAPGGTLTSHRKTLVVAGAIVVAAASFAVGAIFWREMGALIAQLTPLERMLINPVLTLLIVTLLLIAARKRRTKATSD